MVLEQPACLNQHVYMFTVTMFDAGNWARRLRRAAAAVGRGAASVGTQHSSDGGGAERAAVGPAHHDHVSCNMGCSISRGLQHSTRVKLPCNHVASNDLNGKGRHGSQIWVNTACLHAHADLPVAGA